MVDRDLLMRATREGWAAGWENCLGYSVEAENHMRERVVTEIVDRLLAERGETPEGVLSVAEWEALGRLIADPPPVPSWLRDALITKRGSPLPCGHANRSLCGPECA